MSGLKEGTILCEKKIAQQLPYHSFLIVSLCLKQEIAKQFPQLQFDRKNKAIMAEIGSTYLEGYFIMVSFFLLQTHFCIHRYIMVVVEFEARE